MTYLTQRTAQRAADRAEQQRRAAALTEERRAEQIRTVLEFIRFALEAEGVAHARPPRWEVDDDWYRTARPAVDGLRIAEHGVQLLCAPGLHVPVTAYARALNQVVWQEHSEASVSEYLEPVKAEFLAVARLSLT
ncbi:hypothetical protein [Streptomyces sp. RKAG290]|uniref:hypothetical protein n=1 Tax=Streptomyces sp. RKAG290 TaxID=2888348 RepID=UPI002033CB79|nr:hypothetical protein [Streptomyces sp. RKAG290]MCM2416099.1 hypothetical protein [Streptomyces sp. RKAG290]